MPKQSNDIFSADAPAIAFSKSDQKWKIDKNVDVGASAAAAVFSKYANSDLVNKGTVYAYGDVGVYFGRTGAMLLNKETGHITGGQYGVQFDPFAPTDVKGTVINHGEIAGLHTGVRNDGMGDFKVENYGEVLGSQNGIYSHAFYAGSTAGPVIKNYDSIKSEKFAIRLDADAGLRSKVVNQKNGVIDGGEINDNGGAAVYVSGGEMTLINKGKINGDVYGSSLKDTITNSGKIDGHVYLRSGEDTFDNTGGKVTGLIFTGFGDDKLIAGDAKDKFVFYDATNIDRIKNFESGKDKFILTEGTFGDLVKGPLAKSAFRKGTEAEDGNDRIIYDQDSGKLYLDDGVGGDDPVQFAKVDPGQKLKYSDFAIELFV
ncbi:hypothetical protein [Bauldia sp.]|uniref:hypothetical protein n=1 Tax=Bauldia sp. TaxID=2575872 RepID=UPI003BAD8AD0